MNFKSNLVAMEHVNRVIYTLFSYSTSDVGTVNYVHGGTRVNRLVPATRLFCDTFILWRISDNDDDGFDMRRFIRHNLGLTNFNVSFVSEGILQSNDFGTAGQKYKSYKVSVSRLLLSDVLNCLSVLPLDNVYLHDYDTTVDCHFITTRKHLWRHLLRKGVRRHCR